MKKSIQHYVSKMFIRRFMDGKHRLHTLYVDNSNMGHGKLKDSFGEKELWCDDIEQKLSILETKINKILQEFDKIKINKQPNHKCTIWTIENIDKRQIIIKMALLQPNLLNDLKDGEKFEKNILDILNNDSSSTFNDVFYVKLYKEHCNGKFLITDYLGQPIIDFIDLRNVNTIENIKAGKIKYMRNILPYYFVTGEYEFFFVGDKEQLEAFLELLRRPIMYFKDNNGKEYIREKKQIDQFELTAFNLNQLKSQESQCEVGCYDEKYLEFIRNKLPHILNMKIMWRETSTKNYNKSVSP